MAPVLVDVPPVTTTAPSVLVASVEEATRTRLATPTLSEKVAEAAEDDVASVVVLNWMIGWDESRLISPPAVRDTALEVSNSTVDVVTLN
jgi:hypothetical protein